MVQTLCMFVVLGLGTGIKCFRAGGIFFYSVCVCVFWRWSFFTVVWGLFLRGSFTVAFLDQLFSFL